MFDPKRSGKDWVEFTLLRSWERHLTPAVPTLGLKYVLLNSKGKFGKCWKWTNIPTRSRGITSDNTMTQKPEKPPTKSIPQARVTKNAHLRHEPSLGVITHYLISELLQKECEKRRILTEKAKKDKNRAHVKYLSDHLQNCTFLMFGCQPGITWVQYKTVFNKLKRFLARKGKPN